jgi:2-polyprenyl-3-methyl-5-hydroxy-6-metoxy-1,4-benzoquinol methylase
MDPPLVGTVLYTVRVFHSLDSHSHKDSCSYYRLPYLYSHQEDYHTDCKAIQTPKSMNLVDLSRSLLIVPTTYNDVRPHHLGVGLVVLRLVANSKLMQTLARNILSVLSQLSERCIPLIHKGLVPDTIIRLGIRIQLYDHLNILKAETVQEELHNKLQIVQTLKSMPIAIQTEAANQQHYEVPAKFYDLCLGPRKKYSSGLWPSQQTTFEESEVAMLEHYCQLANVKDGMKIVDLGCGWGSLTLHLAERYPNAKITGISNSHSQRDYILQTAKDRGYNVSNITIITCNVSDDKGALKAVQDNDLVMTVEM